MRVVLLCGTWTVFYFDAVSKSLEFNEWVFGERIATLEGKSLINLIAISGIRARGARRRRSVIDESR